MTILIHDLGLALTAYFVLAILQVIALPFIFLLGKKFTYIVDSFWAFGRFATLLSLSFLIWILAHLGLPVNTALMIYLFLFLFALLSFRINQKIGLKSWKFFWQKNKKIILIEEIIFLLTYLFILIMRSFQPEILSLEKFMDAGFIQVYLKAPTLPATDMWLIGRPINYYSFGHFYHSVLVNLWQIDLAYAYNFLLASLFAIFSTQLFSLTFNLRSNLALQSKKILKKIQPEFIFSVLSGILAILLVAVGGNGHSFWYFLENGSLDKYWYPDATRFIERTIHEFPAYSFIVSDLHPHVLALPLVSLTIVGIYLWLKTFLDHLAMKKKAEPGSFWHSRLFFLDLFLGFCFGVFFMTNTWDVLNIGMLLIFLSFYLLIKNKRAFLPLFFSALTIVITLVLTSSFWYLNFESISQGVRIALEHSPLWQLLALWGPHLFLAAFFILLLFRLKLKKTLHSEAELMMLSSIFLTALVLVVLPEVIYFKDIYTTYPRANTMFKLLFQAFSLLGILVALLITVLGSLAAKNELFKWHYLDLQEYSSWSKKRIRQVQQIVRQIVFLYLPFSFFLYFVLLYPYQGYSSFYANLTNYQGLNGLAWFESRYPEDFEILNYLKNNEARQVPILEAPGDSYTEHSKISAFSGMPTILGWRVHEWLWRGNWDIVANKSGQVTGIYNQPNEPSSETYLKQYQIKYIVIGDAEKEEYPQMQLQQLLSLGEIVYSKNGHYLIKLY